MNTTQRLFAVLLLLSAASLAENSPAIDYTITFGDPAQHRVHVTFSFESSSAGSRVQMPVWNATYQVRDFARNIMDVRGSASGQPVTVHAVDKTTWELGSSGTLKVEYDILLDEAGPFGAQFNEHHAFLNLAQVLMYPEHGRALPIAVHFTAVPAGWKLATPLPSLSAPAAQPGAPEGHVLHALNYDRLVDSPCELGQFAESDFEEGGAKYRVVVDADPADYDFAAMTDILKKIVATETGWMQDRPYESYMFIYHIPRGPAGGGMEHAYSTAIDISANQLRQGESFQSVSAHEFFHLWNVKRIRPQTLEPIDYTRENYTRALWFSEGVTSTVAELMLSRAGLTTSEAFLKHISSQITTLQARPAHTWQSAEESSLDAWLEKYPFYRAPGRSVNYYNKGELLGDLLDLKIREDSHGHCSLRDLFQAMNRDYAQQGRFFPDSDGVRSEAEKLTHSDLREWFHRYVAGVEELPYAELFATAGLQLSKGTDAVADPGFTAARNFSGPLLVDRVAGQNARDAGMVEGTEIVSVAGQPPARNVNQQFAELTPGSKVKLVVSLRGAQKEVELTLGSRNIESWTLSAAPNATPAQLARRAAWMRGEDESQPDLQRQPAASH